ncbi:STAS domain-containing protein [Archangium violaceum]|uniref:STAS domain-containing protein n=1 Tax=Archangium violaceum Cb vi76 TaxID=1406225 RepID=A0A084SUN7_9BACT|nr:STAS domain-containing protein [Archangium violaceum]KFA92172.1 hypothetical protein Q664_17935 [Archangium violaceum Cb vi76]
MNITSRSVQNVEILKLDGPLTGAAAAQVRDAIFKSLSMGARRSLLDMSSVATIDEPGIASLILSTNEALRRGGKAGFLNLLPEIKEQLSRTWLLTVCESYDNETKALQGLC